MDLQRFPDNFCTDFPLKVKYSDFHKIYITIPKQSLDIYILHPSVTCCHVSPIFVCIRYLHLPVRSNLYLMYFVFHDTWSESLTTLSESQYLYQENYHSMVQCAALNCTIKSGHGISMYLFPKDAKLRKIWTVRLKTDGFQPSQYTKLCERHFEKNQGCQLGSNQKQIYLIQGAVPSIFDHSNPKTKLGWHGKRLSESPMSMYKVFKGKCLEKMFKP